MMSGGFLFSLWFSFAASYTAIELTWSRVVLSPADWRAINYVWRISGAAFLVVWLVQP
jgi:hypothetical protein